MKGELMFEILSALEKGKDDILDLVEAYMIVGYAHNPFKGVEKAGHFLRDRERIKETKDEKRRVVRRFYAMVSYLEKDGLVYKTSEARGFSIRITGKGKSKLENLKNKIDNSLPDFNYKSDASKRIGGVTIIAFDVPEKYRQRRDWLRDALKSLDFDMVQRSVWMGKGGVPENLLLDLKKLNLGSCVQIFQITKMGSLKQLL